MSKGTEAAHGWAYCENVLTDQDIGYWNKRIREDIKEFGHEGTIRKGVEDMEVDHKFRRGKIHFLEHEEVKDKKVDWEAYRLYYLCVGGMKAMYDKYLSHLQLEYSCSESKLQLSEYRKGDFYNKHHDGDQTKKGNPYDRVLSCVLCINSSTDGGDFYFTNAYKMSDKDRENINKPGTLTVFPSFAYHGVNPVNKGIRRAVTLWLRNAKS